MRSSRGLEAKVAQTSPAARCVAPKSRNVLEFLLDFVELFMTVKRPRECGPDAWKTWLRQGFAVFDRSWTGWALAWWTFSLLVVWACLELRSPGVFFAITIALVAFSPLAFGSHQAVFDALASGKPGMRPWVSSLLDDWKVHGSEYARTGAVRAAVTAAILLPIFISDFSDPEKWAQRRSDADLFAQWSIWVWIWLIPAGWQKGGYLGWWHFLVRRNRVPKDTAMALINNGRLANQKSLTIVQVCLMLPTLLLMLIVPPLLPLWEMYTAAVSWKVYDDIFGDGDGIKQPQKAARRAPMLTT